MLLEERYDFKSLVLSFFVTSFVVAFFICTVFSVIVKARRDRAARIAALTAVEKEAVVLKPLKSCRMIVIVHPDGEMVGGDPDTPSSGENIIP